MYFMNIRESSTKGYSMQDNGIKFAPPTEDKRKAIKSELKGQDYDEIIVAFMVNDQYLLEQLIDLRKEVETMKLQLKKYEDL